MFWKILVVGGASVGVASVHVDAPGSAAAR